MYAHVRALHVCVRLCVCTWVCLCLCKAGMKRERERVSEGKAGQDIKGVERLGIGREEKEN